uniref:Rho-GAP domain-containing protein n=1 Tax=Macrostomum lignano TaxID=282301 RepID=A0A1I8FLN2_9PLAT
MGGAADCSATNRGRSRRSGVVLMQLGTDQPASLLESLGAFEGTLALQAPTVRRISPINSRLTAPRSQHSVEWHTMARGRLSSPRSRTRQPSGASSTIESSMRCHSQALPNAASQDMEFWLSSYAAAPSLAEDAIIVLTSGLMFLGRGRQTLAEARLCGFFGHFRFLAFVKVSKNEAGSLRRRRHVGDAILQLHPLSRVAAQQRQRIILTSTPPAAFSSKQQLVVRPTQFQVSISSASGFRFWSKSLKVPTGVQPHSCLPDWLGGGSHLMHISASSSAAEMLASPPIVDEKTSSRGCPSALLEWRRLGPAAAKHAAACQIARADRLAGNSQKNLSDRIYQLPEKIKNLKQDSAFRLFVRKKQRLQNFTGAQRQAAAICRVDPACALQEGDRTTAFRIAAFKKDARLRLGEQFTRSSLKEEGLYNSTGQSALKAIEQRETGLLTSISEDACIGSDPISQAGLSDFPVLGGASVLGIGHLRLARGTPTKPTLTCLPLPTGVRNSSSRQPDSAALAAAVDTPALSMETLRNLSVTHLYPTDVLQQLLRSQHELVLNLEEDIDGVLYVGSYPLIAETDIVQLHSLIPGLESAMGMHDAQPDRGRTSSDVLHLENLLASSPYSEQPLFRLLTDTLLVSLRDIYLKNRRLRTLLSLCAVLHPKFKDSGERHYDQAEVDELIEYLCQQNHLAFCETRQVLIDDQCMTVLVCSWRTFWEHRAPLFLICGDFCNICLCCLSRRAASKLLTTKFQRRLSALQPEQLHAQLRLHFNSKPYGVLPAQ